MSEVLTFSLKLDERKVNLTGIDGTTRPYTIKEFDGSGRDAYLTELEKSLKFSADGKKVEGLKDLKDIQSSLLSLCLFDENNKNVGIEVLRTFPASTLSKLFRIAQELNGFGSDSGEQAKNV